MNSDTLIRIAVLGSAGVPEDSPAAGAAHKIGELIALQGGVTLTGGCPGLPHAAARGARSAGGLTIAISPAMNMEEHAEKYSYPDESDIFIFTGMGAKGRNVILVRSADACVFVGGGMGTLNEFTIAFADLGPRNALGVLSGSGGFSDDYPRLARREEAKRRSPLVVAADPVELMTKVFEHIRRPD